MNQLTASLWGDEAWAATLAAKSYFDIIRVVAKDTSPPLYYLLLHTWMQFFGTSEAAIRSLSFLFFLGTTITVYFIGKHLWDKKTGLLAATLVFLNPFLFTYAFEGRMYSLLVFTSTLSVYFFLKKQKIPFILATATALYTHHFSIFVVLFEGLWQLKQISWKSINQIIAGFKDFFLIGLLYLPWFYPLYYQTTLVGSGFWLQEPTVTDLRETIQKFLVASGPEQLRQSALYLTAVILLLRNWFKKTQNTIFLLGWFFTPLLATFTISQFFQPIFFDRYMLISIPAACLLLASQRRKISLPFIAILAAVLAFLNFQYFAHPTKRPFKEMATYIKQQPKLPLINYNAAAHHLWEAKYYGLSAPIYAPKPLPFYTGTALMEKEDTIANLPATPQIGVITSDPPNRISLPGFQTAKINQFGSLSFMIMERKSER